MVTMTKTEKHLTTWTPQKAAQDTGVSRSTIMRMITNGKLPNAKKINGKWAIPVTDLGAAGLSPGQSRTPDQNTDHTSDRDHDQNSDRTPTVNTEVAILTAKLEAEHARRIAAEQLAQERLARVEDLHRALNDLRQALPIGHSDSDRPTNDHQTTDTPPQQPVTTKRPSFWRRLFTE